MSKCKITIVKRTINQELVDQYLVDTPREFDRCQIFQDGQEFIITDFPLRPDSFCDWAWADIQRDVVTVMFGGSYPWLRDTRTAITCCTDGLRPVIFKVEMVE